MYIDRGFRHPGGVSPMKQEDMHFPDPNKSIKVQVSEANEKRTTTKKEKEEVFNKNLEKNLLNKESESSKPMNTGDKVDLALATGGLTPVYGAVADAVNVVQNTGQAIFNAVTGDYKEAKHDATNALWAAGAFIPAGIGQWFTGMKLAKATAKTAKSTKTGAKVTADFLNNATEAEVKASKTLSNTQKAEILNARVNTKIAKEAAEGIVNGKQYYTGATHYGKVTTRLELLKTQDEIFEGITAMGRSTDEALAKINYNVATDLKVDNITKLGEQSGRQIFEVAYPNGTSQRFWRSSGGGKKFVTLANGSKVSSEGFFGTLPGHMDVDVPGMKVAGWFIKGEKWTGYDSKTFTETGAVLKDMFDKGLIK